jgi:hypothetical protein
MGFTVKSYICVKSKEINQLKLLGSGSVITRPGDALWETSLSLHWDITHISLIIIILLKNNINLLTQ